MPDRVDGVVDHLFRRSAGQMVATLTRVFGAAHLALAEEVVQDALVKALQQWKLRGIPDDPAAWLGPDILTVTLSEQGEGRVATVSGAGAWKAKLKKLHV